MFLLKQLVNLNLVLMIFDMKANGENADESQYNEHNGLGRHKRSISCGSIPSLKKYTYTSGHTACLSPSSSANLTTAGVTNAEKTEIVNKHNEYRATESATNMLKMSWDDEVAYIAQKWAENCYINHDSGHRRRIPGRFSLGQNLASSSNINKMTWSTAIQLWYDEIADFTYNSSSNVLAEVGHYTQVVWAKSSKIGCGYAKCGNIHYLVCNYGPGGNSNIKTPYNQGTKCADCAGHCVNNLCDCNGMVCLNGGNLDLSTCACSCMSGYNGPDCALNCSTLTDPYYCANQYTYTKCAQFTNVPRECPHMCQFCPNAGVAVTGATDGKGVLLVFNTTGDGSGGYGSGSTMINTSLHVKLFHVLLLFFLFKF